MGAAPGVIHTGRFFLLIPLMGGAYPYMDLNAKYEKRYYDVLLRLIQIRISPNEASAREIATCKQNVGQKEDFMHNHNTCLIHIFFF
jgi:hypothetical protein